MKRKGLQRKGLNVPRCWLAVLVATSASGCAVWKKYFADCLAKLAKLPSAASVAQQRRAPPGALADTHMANAAERAKVVDRIAKAANLRGPALQFLRLAAVAEVSVFLTGRAGTGKTSCARALFDCFEAIGVRFRAVAPTWAAARNLAGSRGSTVHREFRIPVDTPMRWFSAATHVDSLFANKRGNRLKNHWMNVDAVVIDEVSMTDPGMLW